MKIFFLITQYLYSSNLLCKDNKQVSEYVDEVKEQIKWVGNVVFATHSVLLNDELSVVNDKSTHHKETNVKMDLVKQCWSEEDIG